MKNSNKKIQNDSIGGFILEKKMTVDLETTLILKKKIIRPIRLLFRKKRKIYRFLVFRESFFEITSDKKV